MCWFEYRIKKICKKIILKDFFEPLNNSVFRKAVENARIQTFNLVTAKQRRSCLVSQTNFHTTKWFSGNVVAIEIKKTSKLNKPA